MIYKLVGRGSAMPQVQPPHLSLVQMLCRVSAQALWLGRLGLEGDSVQARGVGADVTSPCATGSGSRDL